MTRPKLWPDEQILSALRAFAAEHGRAPTYAEWLAASYEHPASNTVARRFGSWRKALAAADLPDRAPGHKPGAWTASAVIQAIYVFRYRHGRLPRRRDWEEPFRLRCYPHTSTVKRLFGSWNAAFIAGGFEPYLEQPYARARVAA